LATQPHHDAGEPGGIVAVSADSVTHLKPVSVRERIESVDFLRGFALMGILIINIWAFGLSSSALFNPMAAGGFEGLNLLAWQGSFIFFFQKMMAIFSMLFGAGVVLMYDRYQSIGGKFAGMYYRRILWLALFGIVHAYFLWYGDILFVYAIAGLLLYPVRRLSGKVLIVLAVMVLLIGTGLHFGAGFAINFVKQQAEEARADQEAGETLSHTQEAFLEAEREMMSSYHPDADEVAEEIAAMTGGYWEMISYRFPYTLMMHLQALPFFLLWRALGLMLLGMALMKMRVFAAERGTRFYIVQVLLCYVIGFPLTVSGMSSLISTEFEVASYFMSGGLLDYIGSVFIAVGHVGVLILVYRSGVLSWLRKALIAAGRMAFTNYLLQTFIGIGIFWGLGLFGSIDKAQLLLFVVGIWIVELTISPIWLSRFRFGPFEWLWRSLTYLKLQPMRAKELV